MRTRNTLIIPCLVVALSLCLGNQALAGQASDAPGAQPLAVGTEFPDMELTGTLTPEQAEELGIENPGPAIHLNDIKAQVLILEVFSMYCPHCQAEAPLTLELYELIAEKGLADQVKMIGLGAGNSQSEVDIFRNKYGLPFALFTDYDLVAHQACGAVGTPYFYVLLREPGQENYTVVISSLGRRDSAQAFLQQVLDATGLK